MVSSIEVFETATLEHVESHSFGIFGGSATWVDRADGHWWVAFAHYAGFGGLPDQGTGMDEPGEVRRALESGRRIRLSACGG